MRHETVLLVEDEASTLKVTAAILEKLGYTVLRAGTPAEALATADEFAGCIHLLLTDVIMPEMNGKELADTIMARHSGIRLLYMSGHTADVIARHGMLDESVQFIQKPFTVNDLKTKLCEVLDIR